MYLSFSPFRLAGPLPRAGRRTLAPPAPPPPSPPPPHGGASFPFLAVGWRGTAASSGGARLCRAAWRVGGRGGRSGSSWCGGVGSCTSGCVGACPRVVAAVDVPGPDLARATSRAGGQRAARTEGATAWRSWASGGGAGSEVTGASAAWRRWWWCVPSGSGVFRQATRVGASARRGCCSGCGRRRRGGSALWIWRPPFAAATSHQLGGPAASAAGFPASARL